MKYLFILLVCLCVCADEHISQEPDAARLEEIYRLAKEQDRLWELYQMSDTIIKRNDSVIVVNRKYDTTMVATGIFTYLSACYPVYTPAELLDLCRNAVDCEEKGMKEPAAKYYSDIVDYYYTVRPETLKGYSCLNGYFEYNVHTSILCAHAYDKLDSIDRALAVLRPFLANVEADHTSIKKLYIELCIKKYGRQRVKEELDHCSMLSMPRESVWGVDERVVWIFGAEVEVYDFPELDEPSRWKAIAEDIRQEDYYRLVE